MNSAIHEFLTAHNLIFCAGPYETILIFDAPPDTCGVVVLCRHIESTSARAPDQTMWLRDLQERGWHVVRDWLVRDARDSSEILTQQLTDLYGE